MASGNLTAAAQTVVLNPVPGTRSLIQVSGTYGSLVIAVEGSPDGTNWSPFFCSQIGPAPGPSLSTISLVDNSIYLGQVVNLPTGNQLRVRCVSIVSGTGAVLITSTGASAASASGPFPIQGPNPWIDVTAAKYGAVGDGATDDTTAIQSAITDMVAAGSRLWFPGGKNFKITSVLSVAKSGPAEIAFGPGATLDWYGGNTGTSVGTITAATNATPIVCTITAHGLVVGDQIYISGAVGNTNANGWWVVSAVTANTFTLQGSIGNGAWSSGGAVTKIGAVLTCGLAVASTGGVINEPWTLRNVCVRWKNGGSGDAAYIQNAMIGIRLLDIVVGEFYRPMVYGMGVGIQVYGQDSGCWGAQMFSPVLHDNGLQLHQYANNVLGANGGYVTELNVFGGSFDYGAQQPANTQPTWQFKSEVGATNGGTVAVGAVRFFGTTFQANNNGARFDLLSGTTAYVFEECRYETVSTTPMTRFWAANVYPGRVRGCSGAGALGHIQDIVASNNDAGIIDICLQPAPRNRYFINSANGTAQTSAGNGVAETSIWPAGSGAQTLPAYFFCHRNRTMKVEMWGFDSNTVSSQTATLKLKIGSLTIAPAALTYTDTGGTNRMWKASAIIVARSVATQTAVPLNSNMDFILYNAAAVAPLCSTVVSGGGNLDATATAAMDITWTWGLATSGSSATLENLSIEVID